MLWLNTKAKVSSQRGQGASKQWETLPSGGTEIYPFKKVSNKPVEMRTNMDMNVN